MCVVTIGRRGAEVFLRNDTTRRAIRGPWSIMLTFGQQLAYRARPGWESNPDRIGPVVLRRDGDEMVVTELSGSVFLVLPCPVAIEVGGRVIGKAREAQEEEDAEQVIFDQALLSRSGIALGLGNSRAVREEAAREAAWNPSLRRYLPSSAKVLQSVVHRPVVVKEAKPA